MKTFTMRLFFKPTILVLLFFSALSYAQKNVYKMKPRPIIYNYLSAPDSLGVRHHLKKPLKNKRTFETQSKLPYPVIFIHGLNSGARTWDSFTNFIDLNFNLTFGGRFDISLNYNQDLGNANLDLYPTLGADIALYQPDVINNADYYYVNFAVNSSGEYDEITPDLSNQSAISKQGKALQLVIEIVLQLTNRDKVILLGHSMGGLAAREYLQNNNNWQLDDFPHVAKLATTGTPHGGSNAIGGEIFLVDYNSEAIRDLKKSSVFLEGGFESDVSPNYYNNDVNCNGITNDTFGILGLNQRSYYSDIDYSCVAGTALSIFGLGGDGAVTIDSAIWNNANAGYSNLTENIYTGFLLHNQLTSNVQTLMQALDEPGEVITSYEVFTNQQYIGFITEQSNSNYDFDLYKININNSGLYDFNIQNSYSSDLNFNIYDVNGTLVSVNYLTEGEVNTITLNLDFNLSPYYLEFYSLVASDDSYLYPYTYSIEENTLSTVDIIPNENFKLYPNPTKNLINFNNLKSKFENLEIYNVVGQLLNNITIDGSSLNSIDISSYEEGIYIFKFRKPNVLKTLRVIKK